MGRIHRDDVLFEPIQLGLHLVKRRFYASPHAISFGARKPLTSAQEGF